MPKWDSAPLSLSFERTERELAPDNKCDRTSLLVLTGQKPNHMRRTTVAIEDQAWQQPSKILTSAAELFWKAACKSHEHSDEYTNTVVNQVHYKLCAASSEA